MKSEHVLLFGKGAEKFAKLNSMKWVNRKYFYDEKRFEQLQKIKQTQKTQLDHSVSDSKEHNNHKYGTVGAVALDCYGNIAAATSTGGMTNKTCGRIGDSPIIGSGTYANNKTCAVSCTGHGEYFIKNIVAYDVSALMEYKNMSLDDAANLVINDKLAKQGASGGLIAIDANGNIAMPFNTMGMYRGYKNCHGKEFLAIFKD